MLGRTHVFAGAYAFCTKLSEILGTPIAMNHTLAKTVALFFAACLTAFAQPALETIEVAGHKAYIQPAATPAKDKPWIWYAPNVGGRFIILQHKLYTQAFLKDGIAIASYDLGEVRGAPGSTEKFTLFYEEMVKRGYSAKPILLGQSRGGLMTLAWAVRHPDKVTAWVGIYPVCNLESYPLRMSKKETLADFGMDEATLRAKLPELNPVAMLDGLAKNKVPLFSVHGDKDGTVPHEENSLLVKKNYEALGGTCEVKIIPGRGHEISPAFFECQELIDFTLKHAAGTP
jgi:predicted esterase